MNNRLLTTWITAATILVSSLAAVADPPNCTTTFDAAEGAWRDDNNWSDGVPDSNDVACIDDDCTATLNYGICVGGTNAGNPCEYPGAGYCPGGACNSSPAEAAAIVVKAADGDDPARLEIMEYARLTISGVKNQQSVDSWVEEDEVFVYPEGVIMIDNDLTITGDGTFQGKWDEGSCGQFHTYIDAVGECDGGSNDGEPCAPCSTEDQCPSGTCDPPVTLPTLTIEDPQGESFELRGRWKICVPIQNDAAVISDYKYRSLIVAKDGNSGSGLWRVEADAHFPDENAPELYVNGTVSGSAKWEIDGGGTLILNDTVSGSGDWEIDDLGTLVVNAACTSLSGDVEIAGFGKVEVNENFETSGNLEMSSGSIELATGTYAAFDD